MSYDTSIVGGTHPVLVIVPGCDSDKMLTTVKSIPLQNAFGVPITILAIKNPQGRETPPGLSSDGLGNLVCWGEGYTSVGISVELN